MAGNFKSGGVTKSVTFKYGAKLSLSDSQSKILRYGNPTGSLSKYVEGELIGNIYGYHKPLGIAKTDEEMQQHLASLPNGGQSALAANGRPETSCTPTSTGMVKSITEVIPSMIWVT